MIEITKIKNGLTVITDKNENSNVCTIGYVINSGSYNELENERGIAHFTEHLLFKGTNKRDYKQISLDIESIGGYLNAETNFLYTKYHCTVPKDKYDIGLDVMTDIVFNSIIPEDEFEKEKSVVQEEITMYGDDPQSFVVEKSIDISHDKYDNRKSISGTVESVGNITRDDVVDFIERNYSPSNITLLCTGNINHSDVINFIEDYFNNSKIEFEEYSMDYNEIQLSDINIKSNNYYKNDVNQCHLSICIVGPGNDSEDIYPIVLSSVILGGNSSSILYNEVREERGLAYTVRMYTEILKDSSITLCYSGLNSNKTNIDEIIEIIENSYNDVTEEQLENSKNYYNGMLDILTETSSGLHDFYTDCISKNNIIKIEDIKNKINSVNLDDIKNVMSKYFKKDNMAVVTLSKSK